MLSAELGISRDSVEMGPADGLQVSHICSENPDPS